MHIRNKAMQIKPLMKASPLPGYEYGRGYGIMALPFASGHVLALRVFPENDFAPYRAVWHRTPDHMWSIYVDGPSLDTACPRYFGKALVHAQFANIKLSWEDQNQLTIKMDQPALEWTVVMKISLLMDLINTVSASLSERLCRTPVVLRAMEKMGDLLFDVGAIHLSGYFPNGHFGILMPRMMFPITTAVAKLDGTCLGKLTRSKENPMIGNVKLPARAIFAIGSYYFQIQDQEEYPHTLTERHNPDLQTYK